ncbi:DUF2188 domain-containing protein [Verminephrobacter eiseniae]|uniref:DUF2188 domain-containing protein n=1 Tax=Verminephrobacter eiseniae TaxID=364317 RepID=UPI002238ECFD
MKTNFDAPALICDAVRGSRKGCDRHDMSSTPKRRGRADFKSLTFAIFGVHEMSGKNQWVVPINGGDQWGVRGQGNDRLTSINDTQQQAIDRARDIAINQQSEICSSKGVTARSVSATATVTTRSRPRADVEAGLAGLPLCSACANPRANHSHRHTRRWLTNNAVCVCHGEDVGAGFERR